MTIDQDAETVRDIIKNVYALSDEERAALDRILADRDQYRERWEQAIHEANDKQAKVERLREENQGLTNTARRLNVENERLRRAALKP